MDSLSPSTHGHRMAVRKLVTGLKKRDKTNQERRLHRRYSVGTKVELHTRNKFGKYTLLCESWLMDISYGGVGCLIQIPLKKGDDVFISFKPLINRDCYIEVKIENCRELLGGINMMHGSFKFDTSQ